MRAAVLGKGPWLLIRNEKNLDRLRNSPRKRRLVTHDLKEAGYLANRICVMQSRPGRIIDDTVVPFTRPRTIEMSYTPDFVSMTQRLRELIVAARPAKEAA